MKNLIRRWYVAIRRGEKGATGVEYGLLIALIGAVIIGAVFASGGKINNVFNAIVSQIEGSATTTEPGSTTTEPGSTTTTTVTTTTQPVTTTTQPVTTTTQPTQPKPSWWWTDWQWPPQDYPGNPAWWWWWNHPKPSEPWWWPSDWPWPPWQLVNQNYYYHKLKYSIEALRFFWNLVSAFFKQIPSTYMYACLL